MITTLHHSNLKANHGAVKYLVKSYHNNGNLASYITHNVNWRFSFGKKSCERHKYEKILIAKVLVQLYEHPTLYSIGWLSDSVSTPVKHGTSSLVFK